MTTLTSYPRTEEPRLQSRPVLEARAVTRDYLFGDRTVPALRGVDFQVGAGEFVAFMGPSGSGKTTLLQIAGGLMPPTRGAMLLDGTDLATLPDAELARFRRDRLGFV